MTRETFACGNVYLAHFSLDGFAKNDDAPVHRVIEDPGLNGFLDIKHLPKYSFFPNPAEQAIPGFKQKPSNSIGKST